MKRPIALGLVLLLAAIPFGVSHGTNEEPVKTLETTALSTLLNLGSAYYDERRAMIDHAGPLVTDLLVEPHGDKTATVFYHGWTQVPSNVTFTWTDSSGATITRDRSLSEGQFVEPFELTGIHPGAPSARVSLESAAVSHGVFLRDAIDLDFIGATEIEYVPPPAEASRWLFTTGDTAIEGGRAAVVTPINTTSLASGLNETMSTSSGGVSLASHCFDCVLVQATVTFSWFSSLPGVLCRSCQVEIWESHGANNPSGHRQLSDYFTGATEFRTNNNGFFNVWVSDHETGSGGIDPYIAVDLWDQTSERISMRHVNEIGDSRASPEDAEYYYRHGKAQRTNCLSGATCDLGTIKIYPGMDIADGTTSSGEERLGQLSPNWVAAAFTRERMLDASERLDGASGYSPSQVQVGFPANAVTTACGESTSTTMAFFFRTCNSVTTILLGSTAAQNGFTVAHEYGHHVMWEAYSNTDWPNPSPPTECPQPHDRDKASPAECAWKEGWAEFYSLIAQRSPDREYAGGTFIEFDCFDGDGEVPSHWDHDGDPTNGMLVEGRVTASLWDFIDGRTCPDLTSDDDGVNRGTKGAIWPGLSGSVHPQDFDEYRDHAVVPLSLAHGNDLRTAAAHNGVTI